MKDIDFDELDRAVNSLMGSVPKDEPVKEDDDDETNLVIPDNTIAQSDGPQTTVDSVEDSTPPSIDEEPVIVSNPAPEPAKQPDIAQPAPAAATPPPSRGRFMDVVRPSREMRKLSSPVSRQGATLQPSALSQSIEPSTASVEQSAATQPTFDSRAFIYQDMEDTANIATAVTPIDIPTSSTTAVDAPKAEETDDSTPLSSPFLPDAKVEKRPLGRPAEGAPLVDLAGALHEEADQPSSETTVTAEEQSVTPVIDTQLPEEPLPAELDSKLLSIETGTAVSYEESIATQTSTPEIVPTPTVEVTATPATSAPAENTSPTIDVPRAMAAASIPQQYKLETLTNEEVTAGAIYETQPLAHPAKSKPGWIWVVAIVGILVLGAALGAAVYYLGLL